MQGRRWCAGLVLLLAFAPSHAARKVDCELRYNLAGWSLFYQTASGTGTVRCSDGASIPVRLQMRGGGLSLGKTRIQEGHGRFTGAPRAQDVLGTYMAAEAHAGAARHAGNAQVLSKGKVSLALAGSGQGWSLGIGLNRVVIQRR